MKNNKDDETIADIVAEMRADECIPHHIDWAFRIEAAAKREREAAQREREAAQSSRDARDAMYYAAALVPGDVAELLSLLEGYRSALETIDTKLLNNGRNDERFPKARRMVEKWILRLREGPLPATGNAAAMREALFAVKKSIDGIGASSLDCDPEILMASLTQVCARLSARIDAALSAPPRNCDLYNDVPSAYAGFIVPWKLDGHLDDVPTLQDFANWLFAPAEGENKQ